MFFEVLIYMLLVSSPGTLLAGTIGTAELFWDCFHRDVNFFHPCHKKINSKRKSL